MIKDTARKLLRHILNGSNGDNPDETTPPSPAIEEPLNKGLGGAVYVEPSGTLNETFPLFYSYLEDTRSEAEIEEQERACQVLSGEPIIVNWIIPNFDLVSGGMLIAFELMRYLESHGYRNNIYIFGGTHFRDGAHAKETIDANYCHIAAEVFIGIEDVAPADIMIAVGWQCAWPARNKLHASLKVFLVQEFEAYLYAMGSENVLAEQTLSFGFYGLALGPWAQQVATSYGMRSTSFDFALDHDTFHPRPHIERKPNRVVFYGRYVTPRRAFEIGVVALDIVQRERPGTEIMFHGWGTPSTSVPFGFLDCGIMNNEERAELYCGATVGVALSLTNASMVPLEMMACGLPVAELKGENTTVFYGDVQDDVIRLAERSPRALADTIIELLDEADARHEQAEKARAWVTQRTWPKAGHVVETALRAEFNRVRADQERS